eukprot:gnl/MRDRNA2_/MRDRNA2_58099_c0_seq1.p1 gnl/MRDRNA2_/MRDRNA2_58099_c0~~gnl/MRDRNA2_/MRDRNA2_58099_c0_seq1.p1  ORF type:complete len:2004 (-),score=297.54 gnl/MRDRNA2_/MRDRNA2_58099_c0_seq1:27-6038(-)
MSKPEKEFDRANGAQSSLSYFSTEVDTRAPTPLDRGASVTPGPSEFSQFSRSQTPAIPQKQTEENDMKLETTGTAPSIPPGKRPATGIPAKIGAPRVLPHNTWCIFVEWVPPADENSIISYRLELMTDEASKPLLLDELGTVPRAQFEDLEGGLMYYFRVRSVNEFGLGPWSDWSEGFLMPEFSAESAPESSSDGADSIKLSWIAPCDHGAPLIGYEIQYANDPKDTKKIETAVVMNGKQISNRIHGLQSNQIYYFRSRAINEKGKSDWTEWTEGIATKAVAPQAPRPPRKQASSARELTISWQPPESCGIPVIYYQVRVACEDPTMESAVGVPTAPTKQEQARFDKTQLRVTGLEPNKKYYFQIAAANQIGTSPWSQTSGAIATAKSPPDKCGKVWNEKRSLRTISVQWEAPECYRLPITEYVLRWSNFPMMMDAITCKVPATQATNRTGALVSHTLTNIAPGQYLYFQVAAQNPAGCGEWSICSDAIETYPDVPSPPVAPVCSERTASTFVVAFEAPEPNGDEIVGFQIQMDTNSSMMDAQDCPGVMHQIKIVPGMRSYEYVLGGLGSHNWYYFRFRAWNNVGASSWSPISKPFRVKTERPCKMSSPFCVNSESVHSLVIGFTPSADSGIINGGNIAGYELRYSLSTELLMQNTPPDTGLDDSMPTLEEDNEIAMYLDEKSSGIKEGGGKLSGSSRVAKGIVVVKPPREEYAKNRVMLLRSSPIRIEGLKSGSEYFFQVRAVGDYGEGPWSDVSLPIATQPSRPEKPDPIIQVQQSAFSMVLNLILPEANGRAITSCKLKRLGPNWPKLKKSFDYIDLEIIEAEDVKVIETKSIQPIEQGGLVKTDVIWQLNMLSLAPGACYQLMACYTNSVGTSEWSDPTEPFFCEAIVPDMVALPYVDEGELTPFSITVRWSRPHDNGSDIKHYILVWSDNKNFSPCHTVEPIKEEIYTIDGLSPKRGYYVKVAAINTVGQGKFSEVDPKRNHGYFRTLATVPGPVPRIGIAEKPTHRSVALTWGVPNDDGGAKITRFRVRYSKQASFETIEDEEIFEGTARRRAVHNLEPEKMYFFQVAAGNSVGFGDYDTTVGPVKTAKATLTMMKPPRPDRPSAVSSTSREITIKWKCPELFDPKFGFTQNEQQTHPLSHYHLRISTDPEFKRQDADVLLYHHDFPQERDRRTVPKEEKNVHKFEGLIPGRHYYAAVQAKNIAGLSEYGPPSFDIWTSPEVPAPCGSFQCVEVRSTALVLEWPLPDEHGLAIKGCKLRWGDEKALEGGPDSLVKQLQKPIDIPISEGKRGQPVRYELTGLQPGLFYFVEVAAYNALGEGAFTRSRPFRTEAMAPCQPEAVQGLPELKTFTGVTARWKHPDSCGEVILGYQLRYAPRKYQNPNTGDPFGPTATVLDIAHDVTEYRIEGLESGDCANVVVRCFNCRGDSLWSPQPTEEVLATDLCTSPSEPAQVSSPPWFTEAPSTNHRPYNLVLKCICPPGMGSPVKAFQIKFIRVSQTPSVEPVEVEVKVVRDSDDDFEWSEGKIFSYDTQDARLEPGMEYVCEVKAINDIGISETWSPPSEPGRCPPDYPGRPHPPDSAWQWPNQIELEWSPPKPNGSAIEAYDVRFSMSPDMENFLEVSGEEMTAALEACAVSVGGLTETQIYFFQLRGKNGIGWSDWSNVSDGFLTKASRPARPAAMTATLIEPRSITVAWTAPRDHGSPIHEYELILAEGQQSEKLVKLTDGANECTTAEGRRSSIRKQDQLLFFRLEDVHVNKRPCEFLFNDLTPGTFYSMSLRAYNGEGPGDWSPVLMDVKTLSTAPEKCQQLELHEATSSSLTVKYVFPHHNGELIDGLRFRWCRMRGPTDRFKKGRIHDWSTVPMEVRPKDILSVMDVAADEPTFEQLHGAFELTNLEPGADYEIQVAASNLHGFGAFSKPVTMQCQAGVPDAPTSVHNAGTACIGDNGASAVLFKRSKVRSSVQAVQAANFLSRTLGAMGSVMSSKNKVAPMPEEQE